MEYSIGTTVGNMVTLDTLGLQQPRFAYRDNSVVVDAANSRLYGHGWILTAWDYGYVSLAARNALKTGYCPGKSGDVVIRTRKSDGTYANFDAVIVWPDEELIAVDKVIGFKVDFRLIEEL